MYLLLTTVVATFLLFFCFTKKIFFKKYSHCDDKRDVLGVNDIPGPVEYFPKLIGSFPSLWPYSKSIQTCMKWFAKYPGILRITGANRTFVALHSGPLIQQVLKSTEYEHEEKAGVMYDLMKPFITNGVLVAAGKFWEGQRKVLMKSQSFQCLKDYMEMLNKHSDNFIQDMETLFVDGQPHQIYQNISFLFLKIINEMITGEDTKSSTEVMQYHDKFKLWKESLIHRVQNPWLMLNPLWRLHPMSKQQQKAVEEMSNYARRRINKQTKKDARHAKKPERNLFDELLDAQMEPDQIVDEVNTMIFAGHETGATAIHFFCLCMSLNPPVQSLCHNEVDELFENLDEKMLTYEFVHSNLKYLERCILETLRLYPSVFMFIRELKSSITLTHESKSYLLPTDTNIIFIPYGIHRNRQEFPNPEVFDPDRFLPEEIAKRHAYSYIPFSAGPRNCLGQKFAMIELKTIACYLLRYFVITTTDKVEDIPILPFGTLTPQRDYRFVFKKRNHEK